MKFILKINCNNPAFGETEDERDAEIGRILRSLIASVRSGAYVYLGTNLVRDHNGNVVGTARFVEEEGDK